MFYYLISCKSITYTSIRFIRYAECFKSFPQILSFTDRLYDFAFKKLFLMFCILYRVFNCFYLEWLTNRFFHEGCQTDVLEMSGFLIWHLLNKYVSSISAYFYYRQNWNDWYLQVKALNCFTFLIKLSAVDIHQLINKTGKDGDSYIFCNHHSLFFKENLDTPVNWILSKPLVLCWSGFFTFKWALVLQQSHK